MMKILQIKNILVPIFMKIKEEKLNLTHFLKIKIINKKKIEFIIVFVLLIVKYHKIQNFNIIKYKKS